jgi:hypothetical protein
MRGRTQDLGSAPRVMTPQMNSRGRENEEVFIFRALHFYWTDALPSVVP